MDQHLLQQLLQNETVSLNRNQKEVDILIGLDSYLQLLGQVNTLSLGNGLQLNMTDCGPILSGQEKPIDRYQDQTFLTVDEQQEAAELCQVLHKFWSLESIGIMDTNPTAKVDEEVNEFFRKTTTRTPDGRSVVRLPYASQDNLPSNRGLAVGRLLSTFRRLREDPILLKKYADIFNEQLSLGFIELVPDESQADGIVIQYLLHHHVLKETSKSTKVRIVFDGSAKTKKANQSLNDQLHAGEKLLPDIAAILLRIRQSKFLISADIEKAFLQLELHLEDRDATRFLWIDPETLKTICYRYRRVPFGLKPSPYLLNRSVRSLIESSTNPLSRELLDSFYVDNAFIRTNSFGKAKEFYHFTKKLFSEAKFNLCQWFSNCPDLNIYISNLQKTPIEEQMQTILGIRWDTKSDELIFTTPKPKAELLTKRIILALIASFYDPTGILTPVSLIGKLFFQTIAHKEHLWDTTLSEEQHQEVKKILLNWTGEELRIPRTFFLGNQLRDAKHLELHVFTDASKQAYGTVAYIRAINDDQAETQFLMSKSRVVPIKTSYSIPQLEALAILTGVRLANYCLKELQLPIKQTYLWTDSMCSLDSLQASSTSGSRFVRNRVKQIQEQGKNLIFSHVPGKKNPADLLTRGVSFEDLKRSTIWFQGLEFLHSSEPLPIRNHSMDIKSIATTNLTIVEEGPPIDVEKFSSFHRLLRTLMVIIHFITLGKLTVKERISRERRLMFRLAQRSNPPSEETIKSLQLIKDEDDDLWIYYGRAHQRKLIFLPHGHFAKLLILQEHQKNNHSSPMFTLSKLRENIWIPQGLSYTKRTRQCKSCKRIKIRSYCQPPFADFPDRRILPSKPFQHAAVDYAGPISVMVNNSVQKVWILLFTCLYSRFVSTELVTDMTTSTFLLSLRRLSSLYGTPETITCDNASQFHLLEEVIKVVRNQMRNLGMLDSITLPEFLFITPHSPWEGGVYERLIGLLKESLLRAGTTSRMFTLEDFKTTLYECTSIVNNRPLTYISSDDDIFPLRPIDFVQPHGRHSSSSLLFLKTDLECDDQPWRKLNLAEEWNQLSTITEEFRRRWNIDYIQVLQHRKDFEHKQGRAVSLQPQKGDVVLISQPSSKSTTWPLGIIKEVKERSAIVRNGRTKRTVEYPWKLLFPLETNNSNPESNTVVNQSESTKPPLDHDDSTPSAVNSTEHVAPRVLPE